jgi:hypothetical protein
MCSPNEFAGDMATQRASCMGCGRCDKRDRPHGTTDGFVKGATDGSGTDAASSQDLCLKPGVAAHSQLPVVGRFS